MILDKSGAVNGYRRAKQVVIDNPKDGVPRLTFVLEWIVTIDGKEQSLPAGELSEDLVDPTDPLMIYNPIDDTLIMPANSGFLQAVIYSDYLRRVEREAAYLLANPTAVVEGVV
jgi:hypothetical protein